MLNLTEREMEGLPKNRGEGILSASVVTLSPTHFPAASIGGGKLDDVPRISVCPANPLIQTPLGPLAASVM